MISKEVWRSHHPQKKRDVKFPLGSQATPWIQTERPGSSRKEFLGSSICYQHGQQEFEKGWDSWAIYNDQPAGWSPQMVVKSKGIPPKWP